jgi:hypothetical protein
MKMNKMAEEWFDTAMAARNLALVLTDEKSKAAWHRFAEECEAAALTVPSLTGR